MKFGGDQGDQGGGFPKPKGLCQSCEKKSAWHMIKVVHEGSWRAAYPHNVLVGWQSGYEPNWSKISMKEGLTHMGWLEYCNECEPQPSRPTPSTLTAEEIAQHSGATNESIRAMLATMEVKELPYNKYKRGGEV